MAKANEHGEPVELIAAGHPVEISSPGKPMFPEPGITKLDLAHYYLAVEDPIMRTVRDRPTLLQRFPNGVSGSNFFQKRIPDSAPDWLQTTIVSTPERHHVAGNRDGRHRPRAVGCQPRVSRLPPMALPS